MKENATKREILLLGTLYEDTQNASRQTLPRAS